jgi:dTDP-4-amino-4,6-dideoxygalactose transaminase
VITLPVIPKFASNNGHIFYLLFSSLGRRSFFIRKMKEYGCSCVFHYLSLHRSEYYRNLHDGRNLVNADRYMDTLVRLPFFYDLPDEGFDYLLKRVDETLGEMFVKQLVI